MTVRIALVGTGYIATVHAAAAASQPGAELTVVANHRPESMDAFAWAWGIRRGEKPVPGGPDGWLKLLVVDAAYKSAPAQTGQVVHLAPAG